MPRAKIINDSEGKFYGIQFLCPGCIADHEIGYVTLPVRWLPADAKESPHVARNDHWDFNGDFELPTFSPSVKMSADMAGTPFVCHSYVRAGRIQFLDDCTHALAGQTVDLPDIDAE